MFRNRRFLIAFALILLIVSAVQPMPSAAQGWRSSLYPSDWTPAYTDSSGRFLHDFSYAGYKESGALSIPANPGTQYIVATNSPYNADPTGAADSTTAIQNALDFVGQNGGGVVYLPPGTYRVKPQDGALASGVSTDPDSKRSALWIKYSNVILRGAGVGQTFLFNDTTFMRFKRVITLAPSMQNQTLTYSSSGPAFGFGWYQDSETNVKTLTADITERTTVIPVSSVSGFNVGDLVLLRSDNTAAFKSEHGMSSYWTDARGILFHRRITAINSGNNTLTINIPTRYYLKTRDNARIHRFSRPQLQNVGVESLSIGMRQNNTAGVGFDDYDIAGTGAYEMHKAAAIFINYVYNGWVRNVSTYKPAVNSSTIHLQSNGIWTYYAQSLTIEKVDMQYAQFQGGGGNGYLYNTESGDTLISNSTANAGRHNYLLQEMHATGTVWYNVVSNSGTPDCSEPHRYLSPSNLVDSMTLNGECFEITNRTAASGNAGHTGTQWVLWNIKKGAGSCAIVSQNFGWGYVIGTASGCSVTRGTAGNTSPEDFLEGAGIGNTLQPQSLYLDQRARRIGAVVSYEAEAGGNTFVNPAVVTACANASGGSMVADIRNNGYVQFNSISVNSAGTRTVTLHYFNGDVANRSVTVSANGGTPITANLPPSGAWCGSGGNPAGFSVNMFLNAGTNTIRVARSASTAINLDRLTVR